MNCPHNGSCPMGLGGNHPSNPTLPPRPGANGTAIGMTGPYRMGPTPLNYTTFPKYGFGYGSGSSPSDLEASWRQSFGSLESILRTCSSVTMMLDSTYMAIFNCYRAVAGLCEHFKDIKAHIIRLINTVPFFRWILRLLRFLLRLVGLSNLLPTHVFTEGGDNIQQKAFVDAWTASAGSKVPALPPPPNGNNSSLLSLAYAFIMVGLPWLVWKMMNSIIQQRQWIQQPHSVAVAQFDFQTDRPGELSFLRGTRIHLAPLEQQPHPKSGWLFATHDGRNFGMVPKNYLTSTTVPTDQKSNPASTIDIFPASEISYE